MKDKTAKAASSAAARSSKPKYVRADSKGRITIAQVAGEVFQVRRKSDGRIVLEPMTMIPTREAWLFRNPSALKSVRRGLQQSAAGKIVKLPPVSSDESDE